MSPWMTPTLQSQRPFSLPPTVSHLCLFSTVPFVIWANIKRLAYSSIYVFKRPSSSVGRDFVDRVLNMGEFGEGGGTSYDTALWSSCMSYSGPCVKTMWIFVWRLCIIMGRLQTFIDLYLVMWYMYWCIIFYCMSYFEGSSTGETVKIGVIYERMAIYSSVNRGMYRYVAEACGGPQYIP
jgi:hypothetical protein